jgi:hypothetical protein
MKRQLALFAMAAGLIAGCATAPPVVNWDSRVGTYTYDQAVKEYGTPDKLARLTDGRKAAEWYLCYGQRVVPDPSWVMLRQDQIGRLDSGQQNFEINLHLTFTTNDVLVEWYKD